ncbi:MAG: oxidoreductase [Pseudomonadota bacterium]
MTQGKVWFITGCSKGLGRVLAEEVLKKGDRVAATARDVKTLAALEAKGAKAYKLDVNNEPEVKAVTAKIAADFGRIDVLVNNAGYGLTGAIEETTDAEARAQMDTNVFGVLNCCRAVLPVMRQQKSGHFLQIASVAGWSAAPGLGIYNASKFALVGLSEALSLEVGALGIRVTIIEPGPFRTEWAGSSMVDAKLKIDDYAATAHQTAKHLHGVSGKQEGDPVKAALAMIAAVEAPKPPLHLPLGAFAVERIRAKMARTEKDIAAWEKVAIDTAF